MIDRNFSEINMLRAEKVLIGLAVVSFFLKLLKMDFSDLLLIISFGILAVFYFFLGGELIKVDKYTDNKTIPQIFSSIRGTGKKFNVFNWTRYGLAVSVIGILFSVLSLRGNDIQLKVGLLVLAVVSLMGIVKLQQTKDLMYKRLLQRCIPFLFLSCLLLSLHPRWVIKLQYEDHEAYIEAYDAYHEDRQNVELEKLLFIEENRMKRSPEEFDRFMREQLPKAYPEN